MCGMKCLQGGLTYRYRELLGSDDRVRGVLVGMDIQAR